MPLTMITAVKDIPVHHDHRTEVTPNARAALIDAGWTPPGAEAGQGKDPGPNLLHALRAGGSSCRSNMDGDCGWGHCPQAADGEPSGTGRHCPLDRPANLARVEPVWNAYCSNCAEGAGPFDDPDDAEAWRDKHNGQEHPEVGDRWRLPLHRTEAGYPHCGTCDGGGCHDCTDPA